jgi:TPR repeat protein
MKKYYLMAIEKGYAKAMNNLGCYYKNVEKDYEQMKIYYLMAIEKGYVKSMNHLGYYYQDIEEDYDKMKEYYLRAINKGDSNAMNNLGVYYQDIEKDYNKMTEYYLMAIEKGHINAIINLGYYYQNNKIGFYTLLVNIENKNNLIHDKINELASDLLIINYKKNKNNIHECDVCLESKINIQLSCNHEICIDCFPKLDNCHLCRKKLN